MINYDKVTTRTFESIPIDPFWNIGEEREQKMHRIHAYPAKFPAFITTKAIQHVEKNGLKPKRIADTFCGCGTVAYEAMRNKIDFWGCDINPVATLISRVKSRKYQPNRLRNYTEEIVRTLNKSRTIDCYNRANPRLRYWYSKRQYNQLSRLKLAIETATPDDSAYRLFFLCAFSNILKPTSRWLTKSIKPQVDPDKIPAKVLPKFIEQCDLMIAANNESDINNNTNVQITTDNILNQDLAMPPVDLIVTSPPYVTSYEYADLHQLSSLWLGYADDYRDLRDGSIGSNQHDYNFNRELKRLNSVGRKVVFRLMDREKRKAKSVAKYYLDIQHTAYICHKALNKNGSALFVIGNTEYKNVRIENAQHLVTSLEDAGFDNILITKRQIRNKILTPYRDHVGRFSSDHSGRKVYSEEFIVIARK